MPGTEKKYAQAMMAVNIFVGEALSYRTVGMIDGAMSSIDKHSPEASRDIRKAIEE